MNSDQIMKKMAVSCKILNDILRDSEKSLEFINKNQTFLMRNFPKKFKKNDIFQTFLNYYELNKENLNQDVIKFMEGVSNTSGIEFNKLKIMTGLKTFNSRWPLDPPTLTATSFPKTCAQTMVIASH